MYPDMNTRYEYLELDINLDLKLSQGVKPKNKLDETAQNLMI